MSAFLADWLNLLLRWAHLIAGISWIGTSFYFVALDFSLRKRAGMNPGVAGTAWEVHGGGFYHVEKYLVAPKALPDDLIWFKWEAYLTWVTGFLLLVVQYYWNAGTYLIDPSVLPIAWYDAVAISLGSLIGGWLVYDALCRSALIDKPVLLAAAVFVLIVAAAWGFAHVFSGRGAIIHIGAFIGTIMAANVFAVIIPNQRRITEALMKGQDPDPALGITGKQRSLHNTYLTLPVLLLMIGNHYPMLANHPHSWLLVALILVGGRACATSLSATKWAIPSRHRLDAAVHPGRARDCRRPDGAQDRRCLRPAQGRRWRSSGHQPEALRLVSRAEADPRRVHRTSQGRRARDH